MPHLALPLAACSGEMPRMQDAKKAIDAMKINDRTSFLMVQGLIIKIGKQLIKSAVMVLSKDKLGQ